MNISVFNYKDYQSYLKDVLNDKNVLYGYKSELAKALGCQSSFISQVISQKVHLSQDHAIKTALFLGLGENEKDYFMHLVLKGKAGSKELNNYIDKHLIKIKNRSKKISNILEVKNTISEEDKAIYYSTWWYSAIHILSALGGIKNEFNFAKALGISLKNTKDAINFLLKTNMIIKKDNNYFIGPERIHLDTQSPYICRHHINWRQKVAQDIERLSANELHYSGIIGVSKEDGERIHNLILEMIAKSEKIISKSKEEAAYIMISDFYELKLKF